MQYGIPKPSTAAACEPPRVELTESNDNPPMVSPRAKIVKRPNLSEKLEEKKKKKKGRSFIQFTG